MSVIVSVRTGERGEHADFASAWSASEDRLERSMDLLGPDVHLRAPGVRSTRGKDAAREAFRLAFEVFPDLRASVERWATGGDALFIEMQFTVTIGAHEVAWRNVDRFLFSADVAAERVAYFDPSRIRRAFLRGPRAGAHLLRRLRSGL